MKVVYWNRVVPVLGPFSTGRSKIECTSSPVGLKALTMNHGGSVAVTSAVGTVPGFLPFARASSMPSSSSYSLFFDRSPLLGGMKFAVKIMTKPVTQAAIIIGVVAFALGSMSSSLY